MFLKQFKNINKYVASTIDNNNDDEDDDDDVISEMDINTPGIVDDSNETNEANEIDEHKMDYDTNERENDIIDDETKQTEEEKNVEEKRYQSDLFNRGGASNVFETTPQTKGRPRTFSEMDRHLQQRNEVQYIDESDDHLNDNNNDNNDDDNERKEPDKQICKDCAEKALEGTKTLIQLEADKIQQTESRIMDLPGFDKNDVYQVQMVKWFCTMQQQYNALKTVSNGMNGFGMFAAVSQTSSTTPNSNTLTPFTPTPNIMHDNTRKRIEPWPNPKQKNAKKYFKPTWMQTSLDSVQLAIPMYVLCMFLKHLKNILRTKTKTDDTKKREKQMEMNIKLWFQMKDY